MDYFYYDFSIKNLFCEGEPQPLAAKNISKKVVQDRASNSKIHPHVLKVDEEAAKILTSLKKQQERNQSRDYKANLSSRRLKYGALERKVTKILPEGPAA